MKQKKSYSELLQDPRWQRKRLEILDRDNYACLDCGASDRQLHVQTVTKIQNFKETKDYERGLFAASVWDEGEVEFLSDIRWWNEAYENKKSRVCYENVTGRKPKWTKK